MNDVVLGFIKILGLAIATFAAAFWFRLGYFMVPLALTGVVLAAVVASHGLRKTAHPVLGTIGFIIVYCVFAYGAFKVLSDQKATETFIMTWRDTGKTSRSGEPEVVLEFVDFPGNVIGMYSTDLRNHLAAQGSGRVNVEFEVTRDLWCTRGFHENKIGTLASWSYSDAYAGASGNARSPWGPKHWWCP